MGLFDHLYHLDWAAKYPLQYYYSDGRHIIFDKYEIDMFGNIFNKKTEKRLRYYKSGVYDMTNVQDSKGKQCGILVARAVVSTFHGKPPSLEHTAEHIDCTNKNNDIVCELTWMNPSGQAKNRNQVEDLLTAYVIVRDNIEMMNKEWVKYLEKEKNSRGRQYTTDVIKDYAQRKSNGFSYKIYDNLPNEIWYKVINSENKMGYLEISDKNRIARVTTHARNVIDATRFGFNGKYPKIIINGNHRYLHDVAFETFYPEEYAKKLPTDMILHKFDDKLDFRPHILYIGDKSKNGIDAHDNGCYDGTISARMSCCSYIDGVFEKHHDSQHAAMKYLRSNGYLKASRSHISEALKSKQVLVRYGRTWKRMN
jgi:hypothetical protein